MINNKIIRKTKNEKYMNEQNKILEKLNVQEEYDILTSYFNCIIKSIEYVHFNKRIPEQNNCYITNLKSEYAFKYKDGKYIVTNKKKLINEIINNHIKNIFFLLDKNKNKLNIIDYEKLKGLLTKLENSNDNIYIEVYKDIVCLLFNNKDMILNKNT
jgi:hypothetical protein